MKKISDEQLEIELQPGYKPIAIESGVLILPISELSDREFEVLSYLLFQAEIEDNKHSDYTSISLMQGVSERGRDCVLYKNDKVTGLIQCKKYNGRISRPQVIKEIVKFLLFSTLDDAILPDPSSFEYNLYASNDFTGPAIELINSFKKEISTELNNGKFKNYVNEVIGEYESFSCYEDEAPYETIKDLICKINVTTCNGIDITNRIYKNHHILSMFFNVKTVVDIDSADRMIRKVFDDYGFKVLSDSDLKMMQERIKDISDDDRVNLGMCDLLGFNIEFFRFIKGDRFKRIIQSIANVKTLLDTELLEFLTSRIRDLIYERITERLLKTGKVHPFSVQVANPYLTERLTILVIDGSMPKDLMIKLYPHFQLSDDDLIKSVYKKLHESSERIFNGDFSHLQGDEATIKLKRNLYNHLHQGFKNIGDAKKQFDKDIKLIKPMLKEIEKIISKLFHKNRTVIIKDGSFLDNQYEVNKMMKSIGNIE